MERARDPRTARMTACAGPPPALSLALASEPPLEASWLGGTDWITKRISGDFFYQGGLVLRTA